MKNENEITATTFQLKHSDKIPLKCNYDVGDKVETPLGKGKITWLDKVTGDVKILLTR